MHQIDENKDSAMYNAYMGVEDIGHGYPRYSNQRPKQYVSRRDAPPPVAPPGGIHRTQSSPAMYYSKNRHPHRPSYNHHYDNYTPHHAHPPHPPHPHAHAHAPPPSSYYAYSHPTHPPPPHHYPPSKLYQNEGQPDDYYSRSHSHSHTAHPHYNKTYYSPHPPSKSDKSLSPQIMHVPSKAIIPPPSKAPPPPRTPAKASQGIARSKSPPIMEVPSLLSKTKRESIDIETTKLGGRGGGDVSEIKTTPVALWRQYSEPDAKAMREIERDLNALPLTPPFDPHGDVSSDLSGLGLPTNLMYAKTTPLTLHEDENSAAHNNAYGAVNDVYYSNIQMMANVLMNQAQQQQMNEFDFAMFDLTQQLKLIKRELVELEEEIAGIDKKTIECDGWLKETAAEGERVLRLVATEKKMMSGGGEDDEWWSKHGEELKRSISQLRTKNMALSASSDVMHQHLRRQVKSARDELVVVGRERKLNRSRNMQFELLVIELSEAVNSLKDTVDSQRHDNFLRGSRERVCVARVIEEYPPEIVIQDNLIRAQVEFYFSDYNLKRDKRLLEKICREPRRGYLSVGEVLGLSRVRQLCNTPHQLYDALKSSSYIDMVVKEEEEKEPLFIGRSHFSPPSEKQFPFRRSVYIYGLPWYADDKYIYAMLNAFGGVTKVHFDHGPDTLDRQIMKKMLEKHRVYKLLSKDSAALTMEFNAMHSKQEQYHCYWCHKQKPCCDGYYHPKRVVGAAPSYRVCLQCAAAKAEEQCSKYDARSKLLKDDKRLRELLLGLPPRPVQQCKTALCVFASQRQASKCVYVRSRLAYDGAFATHYHHYSKLKKEIALSIKPKIKHIKSHHTQPNMRSVKTAPVYESQGTAVLQQ
eukprot:574819_1